MFLTRKGQDEGTAHLLIALMAVFIVLFILFIPPEDRAALLEDTGYSSTGGTTSPGGPILFEKSVGKLEFYPPEGFDHGLPSVHLFSARNAVELEQFPSFLVRRNWFVDTQQSFDFIIEDLSHTKNVILAFDAPVATGPLRVMLNGQSVFEGVLSGPTLAPIRLPTPLLRDQNTITFAADRVGGAFWKTHTINLQNTRVIGDLTDLTRTSATSVFTMSPTEQENLIAAHLMTTPQCEKSSLLTITINDQEVYSGAPTCGAPLRQSVSLEMLESGTNTVRYSVDRGDIRLERTSLDTDLKDVRSFIEYFEVPPALFERTRAGVDAVALEIDFVDDGNRKRAQLNVNGHLTFLDQEEPFYTRVLNPWLQPGARNYIEIIPETPLNIVQVRVRHT